jgi:HSP20 family protein
MAKDDTKMKARKASAPAPRTASDPWAPMAALRQEIDRMFDEFDIGDWNRPGRMWGMLPMRSGMGLSPASDLVETDDGYRLSMELPGLAEKDVEIKVSEGMISLRGEKTEERKEEKKDYHMSERRYGSFQRSFPLPSGVDPDKIDASFNSGVLTVTLPKSPEARQKERRIEVKKG